MMTRFAARCRGALAVAGAVLHPAPRHLPAFHRSAHRDKPKAGRAGTQRRRCWRCDQAWTRQDRRGRLSPVGEHPWRCRWPSPSATARWRCSIRPPGVMSGAPARAGPSRPASATTASWCAVITRGNELVALSAGKEAWRQKLTAVGFTAPLVAGGRVFVLAADRSVSAFDGQTGRKLWTQQRAGRAAGAAPGRRDAGSGRYPGGGPVRPPGRAESAERQRRGGKRPWPRRAA